MDYSILIQSFFMLIILLITAIILLMIIPLLRKKYYTNKEDYLILNNQIYILALMLINFIYIIFWFTGKLKFVQKIIFIILSYFANVYIIFLYINNFLVILDYLNTYSHPLYFFSYLLKIDKNKKKVYEIIIFGAIAFINLIEFLCFEIEYIYNKFYWDDKIFDNRIFKDLNSKYKNIFPFIPYFRWRGLILIILSILTIIYNIYLFFIIRNFYYNKINLLMKNLAIKLLMNSIYLIYSIFLTFITLDKSEGLKLALSIIFLFIILLDNSILLVKYSLSKFTQMKISKSYMGKIGFFINKCFHRKSKFVPLTYSMDNIENISSLLLIENSYNFPLNAFDQEILLMYKNDIFVEDYYLNFLDQFLNILTSSLYKLYNSKIFSIKEVNNKKLGKEMNIDVSSITGDGISGSSGVIGKDEIINSEDNTFFTLYRNKIINDFSIFEDVLNNENIIKNEDLRIDITCYYINSCVNNIFEKNYDSKSISKSLISHMFVQDRNTIGTHSSAINQEIPPCNYYSLTAANAKELYFKNLKTICFKTYDKKYSLEIFEIDEKSKNLIVYSSNKEDKFNLSEIINKYFVYIDFKGVNNTFLPIILGIFKVKVNNFKSLLVIVTDNAIVENVPVENFNNWQLIRFMPKGLKKVSSSKYNRNTIVEDDLIFKRVLWKEGTKGKDCKIKLNNYEEVKNIMISDINFLKSSGCFKFNLLLMYYEYESSQKLETFRLNEIIKIRNNNDNKPEIIYDILPKFFLYEDSMLSSESEEINIIRSTNINKIEDNSQSNNDENNENNIESKTDEDIQLINENYSDDNNIITSKGLNEKIIKYSEAINFNGYSGIFDNYKCLCFFTFENIFQNQKKYQYNYDFYKNYLKKIMKYFSALIENENEQENIDKKEKN